MGWFSSAPEQGGPPKKLPVHPNPFSVYSVLRELVNHLSVTSKGIVSLVAEMKAVRDEVRAHREETKAQLEAFQKEVMMSFSDLQTNVTQLITLAEAAAAAAGSGGSGVSSTDIDALNQKVVDAIHVLTPPVQTAAQNAGTTPPPPPPAQAPSPGVTPASSTPGNPSPAPGGDPNAPVTQ